MTVRFSVVNENLKIGKKNHQTIKKPNWMHKHH